LQAGGIIIRIGNSSMATKTIDFDSRIGMAALAELPLCINPQSLPVRAFTGMAINAFDQAEGFLPNSFNHCFVTLVNKQIHVVPAHESGIRNTFLTLAFWDYRAALICKGPASIR
jgi:hypothetical protein